MYCEKQYHNKLNIKYLYQYRVKLRKSNKLVWLCLNNHQLKITLIESADYLADCKGYASKDTLFLSVYTTPIFNPFISKVADTVVDIKPNIRYINIAHKTTSVASIHNCVGTHE